MDLNKLIFKKANSDFNGTILKKDQIVMVTKKPLSESIVREFTQYEMKEDGGICYYKFEPMPNMCFSLYALLSKYEVFTTNLETFNLLRDRVEMATMPILSLFHSGKHVEINCPPLDYYLNIVNAVGALPRGLNTYTVPIARAYDVIRAIEYQKSYLPKFLVDESLKGEIAKPLKGFDTSIASLFSIPLEELYAANNAYRVTSENFRNVGYNTVADFLLKQPRRYIDKTQITSVENLEVGEPLTLIGKVVDKKVVFYKHSEFTLEISGHTFTTTFFNRSWMIDKYDLGTEVLLIGEFRGGKSIAGQSMESLVEAQALDIVPIYSQSAKNNITTKIVMNSVYEAIARLEPYKEELAKYVKTDATSMPLGKAIKEMHFPSSSKRYVDALETLAVYELIYLQLMIMHKKSTEKKDQGVSQPYIAGGYFDSMVESLPWDLSDSQKEGLAVLNKYLSSDTAEQILLNGDVGAGKTVIAQLACMQALDNGYQSVLAGPTDVLATQLYDTFIKIIDNMPKKPTIAFLHGKLKAKEKRELLAAIKQGGIDIIVGTHSVLNKDIEFNNLGLVIIDEQQKFGTSQREALLNSRLDGRKPDLLAQTATPIPRSTAQAFYGDIDLISIKGKPKGRLEVKTEWIQENHKTLLKDRNNPLWADLEGEIKLGHQVFVVVPMVYESPKMDTASVEGTYKEIQKMLPNAKIGYTHGQLKGQEAQNAMEKFRNKELDILVASTVIEVGVDVPNATRILVLSADRLGASSLHQIRGRVGRSTLPSTCYLVSEGTTLASQKRLQALVDSSDGFEIAKVDLETRGQGDLFGLRQAGDSNLRFSNLVDHSKLIGEAQERAKEIYSSPYRDIAIKDAIAILG